MTVFATRSMFVTAIAAVGVTGGRAWADFDVSPAVGPGNTIVTNAFRDADEALVENVRVFGYAFGETPGQPYFLPDPGFHPLPQTSGLAPGSSVGVALVAPLQYWSGVGAPSFANVGTGTTVRFDFGSSSVVSGGGAVPSPAGYDFAVVDADGEADDHLETFLLAPGGTIASPRTPESGVFLVSVQVTSSTPGVQPSSPTYLLFSNGVEEEVLNDAVVYTRDTFAPGSNITVPEPVTATSVLGAVGLLARRRR